MTTTFAAEGERCPGCEAPLAADQRYCLTCGVRARTARLAFLEVLRADAPPTLTHPSVTAATAPSPAADTTLLARARTNAGLIAGVGVLLLAMLIGVLVGSGFATRDTTVAAADPKPVVVSVGGGAVAPAATATTATDPAAAKTPKAKDDTSSSSAGGTAKTSVSKPKTASKQKLKALSKLSGRAYQKQIDKLGKNIAVPGKAPPKDNKAPAGGGGFQDIG